MVDISRRSVVAGLFATTGLTACGRPTRPVTRPDRLSNIFKSTTSATSLTGFVRYDHWMGAGNEPVTYAEYAGNPFDWYRSDAAASLVIRMLGVMLGRELTPTEFVAIVRGKDPMVSVDAIDCPARFHTTGVDANGKVRWFSRDRYVVNGKVEQCLTINGQPFMSLGCLNPIDGTILAPNPKRERMNIGDDDPKRPGNPQEEKPETPTEEPEKPCEDCGEPEVPEVPKTEVPETKPEKVKGNNGVGNGVDPQPPGNPPINDGAGTRPGKPGNKGGVPSNGNSATHRQN